MTYLEKAWQELKATPTPLVCALVVLVVGIGVGVSTFSKGYDAALVVLILVVTNSLAQMCIDFFPSSSKPLFSAIARVMPILAAVAAYLVIRK